MWCRLESQLSDAVRRVRRFSQVFDLKRNCEKNLPLINLRFPGFRRPRFGPDVLKTALHIPNNQGHQAAMNMVCMETVLSELSSSAT